MAGDPLKPRVLTLTGPTASGKSGLAEELSRRFPIEIVSVDSAVVYRDMDIGTAKPSPTVLKSIPHHLVDIRDPSEPYSAAEFRHDVIRIIQDVLARGRSPLLVGGTMLYFRALKHGIAQLPGADAGIRERISKVGEDQGWDEVHKQLTQVDPVAAARINPNDAQRLQRALEVYEITGQTLSELHEIGHEDCPFDLVELAVVPPRALLHVRIDERLNTMLETGFIDEVRLLFEREDLNTELPSMKAVGYRQIWSYLAGELTEVQMREKIGVATRRLAKHQYTWLNSWEDLQVFESADIDQVLKITDVSTILTEGNGPAA